MNTPTELGKILERLSGVRVLCIGDVMLDRFIYGRVDSISPEAPIPVFTAQREERMLGGAGNVVRNLLSLGASASFATVVGDDTVAKQLTALVGEEKELVPYIITERGRISTKKTRFVAASQQLLRSDSETRAAITDDTARTILDLVLPDLATHQAVILSDYGKGVLTPSICRGIIDAARQKNIPVFVDPKQRDVSVYAGATVLSPNLKELALAAGVDGFANQEAIVAAAQTMARTHQFQYVLTTQGEHGMTLVDAEGSLHTCLRLPHRYLMCPAQVTP